MKRYLYLPNDTKFEHGFYNMYNPKLWVEVEKSISIRERLQKAIGEQYEIRENGVASLGNYLDEAHKVGEEELMREKAFEKAKYNDKLSLGTVPKERMVSIEGVIKPPLDPLDPPGVEPPELRVDTEGMKLFSKIYAALNTYKMFRDATNSPSSISSDLNGEFQFGNVKVSISEDAVMFNEKGDLKNITDGMIKFMVVNKIDEIKIMIDNKEITPIEQRTLFIFYNNIGVLGGNSRKSKFVLNQMKILSGAGLRPNSNIEYYKSADELIERLSILMASMKAGNHSKQLKNEAMEIIDNLYKEKAITKAEYNKLYKQVL